jgi:photosystem II stability/assembly factor-like uncharacterized protein
MRFLGPNSKPITGVDTGRWSPNGMGWIESIYVDPNNTDNIWAGSNTGGLYFTRDHGLNWTALHHHWEPVTGVLSIAPTTRDRLLIGTGNPVFPQSYGHGDLKIPKYLPIYFNDEIKGLQLQPVWGIQPLNRLWWKAVKLTPYTIQIQNRFTGSWITVLDNPAAFKQLLVSDNRSSQWAAAGSRLWVSRDAGSRWTNVTSALTGIKTDTTTRIAVSESPVGRSVLWAAYSVNNTFFLDVSKDWGETWENRLKTRKIQRADIHHIELQVAPDDQNVIYVGAVRLFKSEDGGRTFQQVTRPIHGDPQFAHDDIRSMQVLSKSHVVIGTDGGVFETVDGGVTWQDLSRHGLNVTQFYGLDVSLDGQIVMGGTQDLSQMILRDSVWYNTSSLYADGGDVWFDQYDTGAVFISRSGTLMRSEAGFHRWKRVHPPISRFSFLFPFAMDDDGNWYTGRWELWKHDSIWSNTTGSLGKLNYSISAILPVNGHADSLWLAIEEPTWDPNNLSRKLFSTSDGGRNWTDRTSSLPILAWRGISACVRDNESGELYIGFKQIDTSDRPHLVYRLNKDGSWSNVSVGLNQTHVNTLRIFKRSITGETVLLAGTGKGLFWFDPKTEQWHSINADMPALPVTDLAYDPVHDRVLISTYGGGIWEAKFQ